MSTLLPTNHAPLDATELRLIVLADGTRDRSQLAAELGLTEAALGERLERIARAGLLLE